MTQHKTTFRFGLRGLLAAGLVGGGLAGAAPVDAQPAASEPSHEESAWVGAAAAIEKWTRQPADEGSPTGEEAQGDGKQTARDALEAYVAQRDALDPEAAAAGWLAVFDRWTAETQAENKRGRNAWGFGGRMQAEAADGDEGPLGFSELVEALPGPGAWKALSEAVARRGEAAGGEGKEAVEREGENGAAAKAADGEAAEESSAGPERALALLVGYLSGEEAQFTRAADAAIAWAEDIEPSLGQQLVQAVAPLVEVMGQKPDADNVRRSLRRQIDQARRGEAWSIEVPDLVTLFGEEDARDLLKQIMTTPVEYLQFEEGQATKKLAVEMALENVDSMSRPRFGLIEDFDPASVELFAAMEEKFITQRAPRAPGRRTATRTAD